MLTSAHPGSGRSLPELVAGSPLEPDDHLRYDFDITKKMEDLEPNMECMYIYIIMYVYLYNHEYMYTCVYLYMYIKLYPYITVDPNIV